MTEEDEDGGVHVSLSKAQVKELDDLLSSDAAATKEGVMELRRMLITAGIIRL